MRNCLLLAPHLNDAVLGAGQFIAGRPDCIVATVFAGYPDDAGNVSTPYDGRCGFTSALDAVTVRRDEDKEALSLLQAAPVHLDFVDGQYGESASISAIATTIAESVKQHDLEFVVGPLGLVHP